MKKGEKNMENLDTALVKLCEDLTNIKCARWSHCAKEGAFYEFKKNRKYIKIISYDTADKSGGSVWGFINLANPKFAVGDVLLAAGWNTPALNRPRGNILKGYPVVDDRTMYGPGYVSGYSAGGYRNGSFV
jgi:hypothetical protein